MNQQEEIQLLQDIVRIKSENDGEEAVARYLAAVFTRHGIESELVPFAEGRSSIVATISNGPGKVLAISGHLDVVSAGDEADWRFSPYAGHIEDDVMWGRGTSEQVFS